MCNSEIQAVESYTDFVPPLDVYMIIDNVTYELPSFYGCLHSLTYGVKDMCDNKTTCSFLVTNANVASSCGTDGAASLWVRYHCVSKYLPVVDEKSYLVQYIHGNAQKFNLPFMNVKLGGEKNAFIRFHIFLLVRI